MKWNGLSYTYIEHLDLTDDEREMIIDEGSQAAIACCETVSGEESVIKIIFDEKIGTLKPDQKAKNEFLALCLARENNVKGVPKPLALNGNSVFETVAEGLHFDDISENMISKIIQEQVESLLRTIDSLIKLGISIDSSGTNVLYDPNQGFTVIDFTISEETIQTTYDQAMTDMENEFSRIGLKDLFDKALEKTRKTDG